MDIRLIIYYLCIALGGAASAVINLISGKKAGFSPKAVRIYVAIGIIIGIFSALLMGQLQNFIMGLTGLPYYPARLRIFGALLFLPIWFYFPVKYLGGDFHRVLDVLSAGIYAMLGISKIGCAVYGCCYGIECAVGVSTPFAEHSVFPVQLLECILSLIISAAMLILVHRKSYRRGTVYPLSLIIYGIMRFMVEFLRYYPEAEKTYFFGINFWQTVALICIATGAGWLTYILLKQKEGSKA